MQTCSTGQDRWQSQRAKKQCFLWPHFASHQPNQSVH